MKCFDFHLHLPTPDNEGLERLLIYLDDPDLRGANVILNSMREIEFVCENLNAFPSSVVFTPSFLLDRHLPDPFSDSSWFKVHPRLHGLVEKDIGRVVQAMLDRPTPPAGVIVDCYQWGTELKHNIHLPLVIELARALPETYIVATHGGAYRSWEFRAHTGSMKNVIYDFCLTLSYYRGSDLLKPFQRYLVYSQDRVIFGSDWPYAPRDEQIQESIRLAAEVGVGVEELENIFLSNTNRIRPDALIATEISDE